jgi:CheY-like chemotaxis protein
MSTPRIMVVEDEIIVAMELQERLTSLGYEVVGVMGRGEEAIEKVDLLMPDLLLLDITLAGKIDGIETARRIHERHDIPVVYLTAHSDDQTLQRAKLSTPLGYLVKPFHESELRTTIEISLYKHLQEKQDRQRAERFSTTVSFLGGAVVATDEDGVIRHMNNLAETLTGTTQGHAMGRPLEEVLMLRDRETGSVIRDLVPVNETAAFVSAPLTCMLVSHQNEEIPIEISMLAVPGAEGHGGSVLYSFRENSQDVVDSQDWVSWAANLRLAAALSRSEGKYALAESFYKRALDILEKHLGTDHPKVARLLDELSDVCGRLGKHEESHMMELRAGRIRSESVVRVRLRENEQGRIPA